MKSRWFLASLVLFVVMAGATAYVWANNETLLPEMVPYHWDASGKPDFFAQRKGALPFLLICPGAMLGMILVGRILPWLSPRQWSIEAFRQTYEQIMFIVALMFAYLGVVILLTQVGVILDIGRWLMAGILVALGAVGNLMGKVRPNLYVGIRTPWTIASDAVWERTHRLGAWLMVAGSALGLVLLLTPLNPLWALGVLLLPVLFTIPYSLWLYKRLEAEGKLETQREEAANVAR
jgi:uncharacterized membrane protein